MAVFEETVRPLSAAPGEEVEQAMVRLDVHQAIAGLPDRQRTCVFLHHILGCSAEEIADITGLAASTVRSHLAAGRATLTSRLGAPADGPATSEEGTL